MSFFRSVHSNFANISINEPHKYPWDYAHRKGVMVVPYGGHYGFDILNSFLSTG